MAAKRDLTRAQFKAALARNGFRQVLVWFQDTTGQCPGTSWGAVVDRSGRTYRRETLARIIEQRRQEIAKRRKGV